MKTYTIEEAVNDMALSAGVSHGNGYCNWICSAHLGYSSDKNGGEYAEDRFSTNDESWSTGDLTPNPIFLLSPADLCTDNKSSIFEMVKSVGVSSPLFFNRARRNIAVNSRCSSRTPSSDV